MKPSEGHDPQSADGDFRQAGVARKTFLKRLASLGGALLGLVVGVPPVAAFLSPLLRKRGAERWLALGEAEFFDWDIPNRVDIPETVEDAWIESRVPRGMWVLTSDGEGFTVFNGRCTHLGCQYTWDTESDPTFHPEAGVFHCPCHHAVYQMTGEVIRGPAPRSLDTLEVKVEEGVLYARYQDFRVGVSEKIPL